MRNVHGSPAYRDSEHALSMLVAATKESVLELEKMIEYA